MENNVPKIRGYRIIKKIGAGARSTIYKAIHEENGQQIALKRIIIEKPEDTRVVEQVENEFRVAQRINHPYVRKCYDIRKNRRLFKLKQLLLEMEMFEGQSLEDGPVLSLVDVLLVFRIVANGLHAMHQQGFIHCDIKPNNILLNKAGLIKIIDLGQSCKIGTVKRRIQGTPDYIAPEQVKRRSLSVKTDIFNLGATMYWALTGYNVPTLIPKKDKLGLPINEKCRPPHEIKNKIPVGVSKLAMDCIKNEPADRPPNMMTVMSRLDLLIHSILGGKIPAKNASGNHRAS